MAEGRMLKKVISMSRKLAQLKTDSARLLYTWILPHVDVKGRFSAEPDIVKGYVTPRLTTMTVEKVETCLRDMAVNKLILLYKVNGDSYLEIVKFGEFQTLREDREAPSKIPPPDDSNATPAELPEYSPTSKVKGSKVKLKESKGEEEVFAVTPNAFKDYWNKTRLPKIRSLTEQRRKQLKIRMSEDEFAKQWMVIIDRIAASDFCNGDNDRKWKADIDWLLRNDTFYNRVLEGKYDNKPKDKTPLEKLADFEEQERKRKGAV